MQLGSSLWQKIVDSGMETRRYPSESDMKIRLKFLLTDVNKVWKLKILGKVKELLQKIGVKVLRLNFLG